VTLSHTIPPLSPILDKAFSQNKQIGDFEMNLIVKFMSSPAGRFTRIAAGSALIALGALGLHGLGGIILIVVGLLPLIAGTLDICIFAPLFGAPLSGKQVRASN
jgi:hypothetical protein